MDCGGFPDNFIVGAAQKVLGWLPGHPTGLGFVPCSVSQGQGIILLWQLGRDPKWQPPWPDVERFQMEPNGP